MQFKLFGCKIHISFLFVAVLALFSILDTSMVVILGVSAALIHELTHITALVIIGKYPDSISFQPFGIKMKICKLKTSFSYSKEVFVLLSGCMMNLLIFAVIYNIKGELTLVSAVHLVTGVFNLLPIGILDGGRFTFLTLQQFCSIRTAYIISEVISYVIIAPIFMVGIFLFWRSYYNFTLLLTSIYLLSALIIKQRS